MKSLLLLCLLSLFTVIDSRCDKFAPRKEGFLRKRCIPGYYEGSCLIILEKQHFHEAIQTCQNEYGGRLATAPSKEAIQHWTQVVHFNHYQAERNARYWVGYGGNGFRDVVPLGESRWDKVFKSDEFVEITKWEAGANIDELDDSDCPNYGTVFEPIHDQKFDVRSADEEHYALCETVRWAKLQCTSGWYLLQPIRMCVNVHGEKARFLQAHSICNQEGSFIATGQNVAELAMLRSVIVPLKFDTNFAPGRHGTRVGGFWAGLKSVGKTIFSMDGTKPIFSAEPPSPNSKYCAVFCNDECLGGNREYSNGLIVDCIQNPNGRAYHFPYMCQRFADQSTIKNIR